MGTKLTSAELDVRVRALGSVVAPTAPLAGMATALPVAAVPATDQAPDAETGTRDSAVGVA